MLKQGALILLLNIYLQLATPISLLSQDLEGVNNQGKLYFYWGWNLSGYSKSNISFSGDDYDFTLYDVTANDRQSKFGLDPYFHPTKVTIPQYNFRVGYFFHKNWDFSFGIDHMKYVVQEDQIVRITGSISDTSSPYNGDYLQEDIKLSKDFLLFEHTDGLNYLNLEIRHHNEIVDFGKIRISVLQGLGAGALIPKTKAYLLRREIYDDFHLSGFGLSGVLGVNLTLFDSFFIQSELKGGYMSLPDVRTTSSIGDKASHNFFFSQINLVFGATIDLNKAGK